MRYIVKRIFIVIASLFAVCYSANAQRLISGQGAVYADCTLSPKGKAATYAFGADLSYMRVYQKGKVQLGASYQNDWQMREYQGYGVSNTDEKFSAKVENTDICFEGGYYFRLISDRSRMFNLWGGITGLMGARVYGHADGVRDRAKEGTVNDACFMYGFVPKIALEFFPAGNFSLSLSLNPRFQFYAEKGNAKFFYPQVALGVAYYFFMK